jgi:hypothetical protein
VHGIVTELGGAIDVASTLGAGIGAVLLCAKSCAHLAGHLDFSAKLLTLSKGNIQSHMICGVDPIWESSWRAPQVSSAFGYFRSC